MSSIWKYKYFVDVIESKSFTKAGNMNYVSQTAISQNISSLEKMAGGKLVNRGKGEEKRLEKDFEIRMYYPPAVTRKTCTGS